VRRGCVSRRWPLGELALPCRMRDALSVSEKQTRRRGSALDRAILDAAWEELAERGWAGFTVEGVAARSGAAKTVIYRRWRNRVHLAQEMLQVAAAAADGPFQSSGDLRTDLLRFVRDMSAFLDSPFGSAARGVICEGDLATQQSLFAGVPIVARVGSLARISAQLVHRKGSADFVAECAVVPPGHGGVVGEIGLAEDG